MFPSLAAMRSKLFLPGTRPEFFPKAMASAVDAVSYDLEDSVAPARKAEARTNVMHALRDLPPGAAGKIGPGAAGKIIIVRVNAHTTPHFAEDVVAMVAAGADILNLPMVEGAKDIEAALLVVEAAEAELGTGKQTGLLANIETPKGLRLAHEIAASSPRLAGLQIGYGDLLEPHGIARDEEAALAHIRMTVRMAAAEAGIPAFDGSLPSLADPGRVRAEALAARRLGFAGKSCIHPSQVAVVNEVFTPTAEEVARAERVVAAAEAAERDGTGAYQVDGQMVDAPFAASARALLALARRTGAPHESSGGGQAR